MGVDLSGTVEAVGKSATCLSVGDAVYAHKQGGNGTYAEYAVLPENWVARKPKSLTHVEAAAVPPVALTAYQVLSETLRVNNEDTVLVTGGFGGVGSFAVQLAADTGAFVIATASSRNQAFLKELGASRTTILKQIL